MCYIEVVCNGNYKEAIMAFVKSKSKTESGAAKNQGERLEKQLWDEIKALNFKQLEKILAPEFQSIHQDGARNRKEELNLIKNLHLGNYKISDLKSTLEGDTLVVTYKVAVEETIDNRPVSHKPCPRMSIWKKDAENQWKCLAHANLISLGQH